MALSDSCWEFLVRVTEQIEEFSTDIERYADEYPQDTIDTLIRLCDEAVTEDGPDLLLRHIGAPGYNIEKLCELIEFAEKTRISLDGPASDPEAKT